MGRRQPQRHSYTLASGIIEALERGRITEGRFADFLGVDRLEARRIAEALREYSSGMLEESAYVDLRQA